jgi:hypothetical protein
MLVGLVYKSIKEVPYRGETRSSHPAVARFACGQICLKSTDVARPIGLALIGEQLCAKQQQVITCSCPLYPLCMRADCFACRHDMRLYVARPVGLVSVGEVLVFHAVRCTIA